MYSSSSSSPYFHPRHRCFKIGKYPLKGVHSLLHEWYYPNVPKETHHPASNYEKETETKEKEEKEDEDNNKTTEANIGGPISPQTKGLIRGNLVNKQLIQLAHHRHDIIKNPQKKNRKPPLNQPLHTWAQNVWASCSIWWKWDILTGDVAVGSLSSRAGTAIDLIAYCSRTRSLVPIELKCGVNGDEWTKMDHAEQQPYFAAPLQDIANTPQNRAILQALLTELLRKVTPDVDDRISKYTEQTQTEEEEDSPSSPLPWSSPCVIHVDYQGVRRHFMPPEWTKRARQDLSYRLVHRASYYQRKTKAKRKTKMKTYRSR